MYGFDYEDRLTSIGSNVSYDYIGASTARYSKTVSGTTTQFLYDDGDVDEEMQGTSVTAEYGDYAQKQGSSVYWELEDGQPSTRQLLNSSQTVVASYITDAYGNSVASSGSVNNPFQWNGTSGYYSDNESGLQKVGARYYDPTVGRWVSQDTLTVAGSPADSQAVNRYLYCESCPVDDSDDAGCFSWKGIVKFFKGVVSTIGGVLGLGGGGSNNGGGNSGGGGGGGTTIIYTGPVTYRGPVTYGPGSTIYYGSGAYGPPAPTGSPGSGGSPGHGHHPRPGSPHRGRRRRVRSGC